MITSRYILTLLESNQLLDLRTSSNKTFLAYFYKNYLILCNVGTGSEILNLGWVGDKGKELFGTAFLDKNDIKSSVFIDTEKKLYRFPTYSSPDKKIKKVSYVTADKDGIEKILGELRKFNIISGTYKFKGDITTLSPDTISGRNVLYHGTSQSHISRIMSVGLMPSEDGHGSKIRGNASTIRNWTKNFVYLTPNFDMAKSYARDQSGGKGGVVLKVEVPNPDLLFINDDNLMRKLSSDLTDRVKFMVTDVKLPKQPDNRIDANVGPWSKGQFHYTSSLGRIVDYASDIMSGSSLLDVNPGGQKDLYDEEKSLIMSWGGSPITWSEFTNFIHWLDNEVRRIYPKIVNSNWKSTIYQSYQAIGYKGRIAPKFLTIAWQGK